MRRKEELGSDISLPGYDLTEVRRSDVSRDKPGGGIAFYAKTPVGCCSEIIHQIFCMETWNMSIQRDSGFWWILFSAKQPSVGLM